VTPYSGALTTELRRVLKDARLAPTPLPLTPDIRLYLLNDTYPQDRLSPEEIGRLMDNPPYWCFCWASGQVLARWIMDHRALFSGKSVLDFGAGSGVVAVAAAICGAHPGIALDST
jgi:predicted nicotinamide N-methyase